MPWIGRPGAWLRGLLLSPTKEGRMHINVTTTVQLINDDGQEVARIINKDRTASFDLTDADPQVSRRITRALATCKERSLAAVNGWITG